MINRDYLYTNIYDKINDLIPSRNSAYFFAYDIEMRSKCVEQIINSKPQDVNFVKIEDRGSDTIFDTTTKKEFKLRSSSSMQELLKLHEATTIYIDVTGLEKRIVAALLKYSIEALNLTKIKEVKTVYAEPASYNVKQFQLEGIFYDLSEKIDGISPLPGFASIFPEDVDNILFIAFLGFEGGRFSYVLEQVQPPSNNVIPIIGVPGFRAEYPFVAYWGNRKPLSESYWRSIKYAAANSIVDGYLLLNNILKKNQDTKIKIAPIGTKPHLLSAILFAVKHPKQIELVYDNPKRRRVRTDGVGKIVECSISKLFSGI